MYVEESAKIRKPDRFYLVTRCFLASFGSSSLEISMICSQVEMPTLKNGVFSIRSLIWAPNLPAYDIHRH